MRRNPLVLAPILLILASCASQTPPAPPDGSREPRVEFKKQLRNLQTLHFDQTPSDPTVRRAMVLDAYIYDDGASEVRYDVLGKVMPRIAAELAVPEGDEPIYLVRLFVVTGGDPNEAWTSSLSPARVRAIANMSEPARPRPLRQLPWGYTERQPLP